jgi:hypothetical protein
MYLLIVYNTVGNTNFKAFAVVIFQVEFFWVVIGYLKMEAA